MRIQNLKIALLIITGSLGMEACGGIGPAEARAKGAETLEETVQCTMESLKELDLDTFNECTDNYVETYYNWLGIPVEVEYRVFNELLQPGLKKGKHYRFNLQMAEKIVENLEWEVTDIREDDGRAEIEMKITNRDIADVTGYYEISVWENMIAAEGSGMWQMMKDMADLANGGEELLAIMDALDDTCTIVLTVTAYQENDSWKLHVDDDFINAFMGNMNQGEYSEEIKKRLARLEKEYEDKLAEWENEMGKIKIW